MNLEERLTFLRQSIEGHAGGSGLIPSGGVAIMHRTTDDLRGSGILDRVPRAGARAPEFALEGTRGESVRSEDLLSKGPLVLDFYRGRW